MNVHSKYIMSNYFCQEFVVLNFKMSHSVRNYGDETNDKNNNSMRLMRVSLEFN